MLDKDKRTSKLFGARISSIFASLDHHHLAPSSKTIPQKASSGSLRPLSRAPLQNVPMPPSPVTELMNIKSPQVSALKKPESPTTAELLPVVAQNSSLAVPTNHLTPIMSSLSGRKLTRKAPPPDPQLDAEDAQIQSSRLRLHESTPLKIPGTPSTMHEGLNDIIGTLEQEIGQMMGDSTTSPVTPNHTRPETTRQPLSEPEGPLRIKQRLDFAALKSRESSSHGTGRSPLLLSPSKDIMSGPTLPDHGFGRRSVMPGSFQDIFSKTSPQENLAPTLDPTTPHLPAPATDITSGTILPAVDTADTLLPDSFQFGNDTDVLDASSLPEKTSFPGTYPEDSAARRDSIASSADDSASFETTRGDSTSSNDHASIGARLQSELAPPETVLSTVDADEAFNKPNYSTIHNGISESSWSSKETLGPIMVPPRGEPEFGYLAASGTSHASFQADSTDHVGYGSITELYHAGSTEYGLDTTGTGTPVREIEYSSSVYDTGTPDYESDARNVYSPQTPEYESDAGHSNQDEFEAHGTDQTPRTFRSDTPSSAGHLSSSTSGQTGFDSSHGGLSNARYDSESSLFASDPFASPNSPITASSFAENPFSATSAGQVALHELEPIGAGTISLRNNTSLLSETRSGSILRRAPLKLTPTSMSTATDSSIPRTMSGSGLIQNFQMGHAQSTSMSSIFSAGSNRHVNLATIKRSFSLRPGEGERSNYVQTIRRSAGTAYNESGPEKWKIPTGILPVDKNSLFLLLNGRFNRLAGNVNRAKKASGVELKHGHLKPRLLAAEVDEVEDSNKFGTLGRSSTFQTRLITPVTLKSSTPSANLAMSRHSSLGHISTNALGSTAEDSLQTKESPSSRRESVSSSESVGSITDYRMGYYQHVGYKYDEEENETDQFSPTDAATMSHNEYDGEDDDKPRLVLANPDYSSDDE